MSETSGERGIFDPEDSGAALMASGYETQMVPVVFGPWAEDLIDRLDVKPGDRAVDIACGTGAVTRVLARRVEPTGAVVGVDLNPAMLAVAESLGLDGVEFHEADATQLPLEDANFDVAVCQQGLQFVPDPEAAVREMARVLRPGGRVGLACWNGQEENPGTAAILAAAEEVGWTEGAVGFARAFSMGDPELLEGLLTSTGFEDARVGRQEKIAVFPDLGWIEDFVQGPPFGPEARQSDHADVTRFVSGVRERLERFAVGATHEIPWVGTVGVATKPA